MAKKSKPMPADGDPAAAETAKINKSEEIRVEARRMVDAGQTPRPKMIVEALAARGVDVVSPQVSMVLKRMGVEPRGRKRKPVAAAAPVVAKPASNDAFTLHELLAAKQFVEMIGSPSRAAAILDALGRIS